MNIVLEAIKIVIRIFEKKNPKIADLHLRIYT